jgi:phosphatidylglycerophosphatase A
MGLWQLLPPTLLIEVTIALIVSFTLLGTWATGRLQPFWGEDPKQVVVDEMVGVWTPLLIASNWQQAIIALLLFRFFDIVKPLGIRQLDNRQGAFWVMADDLLAGFYSLIVLHLIILLWER